MYSVPETVVHCSPGLIRMLPVRSPSDYHIRNKKCTSMKRNSPTVYQMKAGSKSCVKYAVRSSTNKSMTTICSASVLKKKADKETTEINSERNRTLPRSTLRSQTCVRFKYGRGRRSFSSSLRIAAVLCLFFLIHRLLLVGVCNVFLRSAVSNVGSLKCTIETGQTCANFVALRSRQLFE